MIDIKLLREDPQKIKERTAAKNINPDFIDELLALDARWRELVKAADDLRAAQKKAGAERDIEKAKSLKEEIAAKENEIAELAAKRDALLSKIPNPPLDTVPLGKSDADNVVAREVGEKPRFDFEPKDYLTIAEAHDLIDTERAAKVSGSRFGYIKGDLVRLEFALGQFLFETICDSNKLKEIADAAGLSVPLKPFIPVLPPVMVNRQAMSAMGYIERGEDEIYRLEKDDLFLVGTSEQSIGPMHMDETFREEDLPARYVGFSVCFRREAGSYGKDTKGILRVHQFNKFEMFSFCAPERSVEEHKFLLAIEEYLMKSLGLPYRVLDICAADLGDPAAAKYDIEAWMPGQNGGQGEYRETHSTSNTTDFQARRLNIHMKGAGESRYLHMLNGIAFSERPLIAIIENYQTKAGGVRIPEVLRKYIGKEEIG